MRPVLTSLRMKKTGGWAGRVFGPILIDVGIVGGLLFGCVFAVLSMVNGERVYDRDSDPFDQTSLYHFQIPSPSDTIASRTFILSTLGLLVAYHWLGNAVGGTFGTRVGDRRVVRKGSSDGLGLLRGAVRTVGYGADPLSLLPGPLSIWHTGEWLHDRLAGSEVKIMPP